MISIETDRLMIRNFRANDWQALHHMIVQYEVSEYAAYDEQWPTSVDEIKRVTDWFASADNFLALCLKDTSQFIGFVGLNPEEGDAYNLGYVFDSDYHGHGYATEACTAILNRAFADFHATKVISGTAAVNRSSCRLLERLGFQKTGEKITSFKTAEDGKPIEFLGYLYAISNDEWQNRQKERLPTHTVSLQ